MPIFLRLCSLLLILSVSHVSVLFSKETLSSNNQLYATLKFDDLCPISSSIGVTDIEQATYDLLMEAEVPHAWGVCRLEGDVDPSFYSWLTDRDAEGIEIWHHGNKHDRIKGESWEFKNRDAISQRHNLRFTQDLIFEKTGIVLRTFGAPYNRTDLVTGDALNEMDEIKIMYFATGSPNFSGMTLNDRVNLERKTGVVASLDAFKVSYAAKEDREIIVLQGHPAYWKEEDLDKLKQIVDFLKAEGRQFITPWEFYKLKDTAP